MRIIERVTFSAMSWCLGTVPVTETWAAYDVSTAGTHPVATTCPRDVNPSSTSVFRV
ncbi:hypothetical protein [Streptosporangium amethystogenes]|uniref:hypothetical protein n=1 Tax=Streptosporangium amethystogenes TaxID=2002 RepID=UPI0012F743BC|nr:hypothetical protein [Streptosporangium amethystogenes]